MGAPTQEAAQGGRIGYKDGTETVQPTYGGEEHFSADMKQNLIEFMKNDKKNKNNKINFSLLEGIGKCSIDNLFSENEL